MSILKRPIITEKSLIKGKEGVYVFAVAKEATKNKIREEVKKLFNVEVVKIATVVVKGKTKRVGKARREVKKSNWKKAIVTLKAGQKIDLFPTT